MSNRVSTPFPIYSDTDGSPLDAGFIFIGAANTNPLVTPIDIFYDAELTMPAENPARTRNGFVVKNGAQRQLFCANPIISIVVQNKRKENVWNSSSINLNPGVTTDAVIDTATGDSQAEINADTLRISENLDDLGNKEQARANLSVYSKAEIDLKTGQATEENQGTAEVATDAEMTAGTSDTKIATPKKIEKYFKDRSLGFNQKYQDLTSIRDVGEEYTNNEIQPIEVILMIDDGNHGIETTIEVDGLLVGRMSASTQWSQAKEISKTIPPQSKYKVMGANPSLKWIELRKLP